MKYGKQFNHIGIDMVWIIEVILYIMKPNKSKIDCFAISSNEAMKEQKHTWNEEFKWNLLRAVERVTLLRFLFGMHPY